MVCVFVVFVCVCVCVFGSVCLALCVCAVVRRLNDLYKSSVMSCRSLSARLERFFSRKHRLMDHINTITAERLLFSHTVQMVGFHSQIALLCSFYLFLFVYLYVCLFVCLFMFCVFHAVMIVGSRITHLNRQVNSSLCCCVGSDRCAG